MDPIALRGKLHSAVLKYRWGLLVVLIGILLMVLPAEEAQQPEAASPEAQASRQGPELQAQLTCLLSAMEGAGKVSVLLTEAEGQQILYQTDREQETDSRSEKTVCVRDPGRGETGLIRQIDPPKYLGAVVLCQGGGSASVRLSIVKAVSSATGLGADKITVLKMK